MIKLASASPRRRDLLKMITSDFLILSGREVDEVYPSDLPAAEVPVYLSKLKADAYRADLEPGDVIITADTVVILHGEILGKPAGRENAISMLSRMQGERHTVVTGVTVTASDKTISFSNSTEVMFDKLTIAEIEHYVDTYKPYDKAGAYGIQEWIGAAAIIGIEGSFYNVMGLPVHSLYKVLTGEGYI